jgi:lysophospholipase L1-like esterase
MTLMKFTARSLLFVCLVAAPWRNVAAAEPGHDFGKWENEIAAFERMDRTNPPPKGAVLFVGSSTVRRWTTLAQDFPGIAVINRGFGGSEIVDSTHFADRIIFPYKPRKIFFRAGGNDLWAGKSPEEVFADFQEFVANVRTGLPETDIVFISWSPTPARWRQADKEKKLNALVERWTREVPHLKYIDTYSMVLGSDGLPRNDLFGPDKLHFNAEGYRLLATRVRPYLTP